VVVVDAVVVVVSMLVVSVVLLRIMQYVLCMM